LPHQAVDELAGQFRVVNWVRLERLGAGGSFSHGSLSVVSGQFLDGSGMPCAGTKRRTSRTVPASGSNTSWHTARHAGQATLTAAARSSAGASRPAPLQARVAVMVWLQ